MAMSPSSPVPASKKGVLLVPVIGIVLFVFGLLLGYLLGGKAQFEVGYEKGKGEGEQGAVKKLEAAGVVPVGLLDQQQQPIIGMTGTVKAVSKDSFDIEGTIRPGLLTPPITKTWKIAVTDETTISRNEIAPQEEQEEAQAAFQKELDAYNKKVANLDPGETPPLPPTPPQLMKTIILKLDDIKEGMLVTVTTKEDLAGSDSATAVNVMIVADVAPPSPGIGDPGTPIDTNANPAFFPPPPPPPSSFEPPSPPPPPAP